MKLSVAMITYNHERFIGQAIQSVLAQKVNFDYEIVIGEDCSTDGTRAIVTNLSRSYPSRIVPLLRERNLGGPQNFLGTLAACRGQYVALLEGDDYWTSVDKLQRQVDFLDFHTDRVMCCHRVKFLHETGSAQVDFHPLLPAGPYTIEDLLRMNFVVTCSSVFRRDLIGSLPRWLFESYLGDWPLHAIVARHGKIELMDEIMATYRVHAGGVWSSRTLGSQLREKIRMLTDLDQYLGFQYTSTIRREIALTCFELACHARQDGNRAESGKQVVNCIRHGGWQLRNNRRTLAAIAAYTILGSWYEPLQRARRTVFL
jgi:glycosyltransferase involved in cell wall biosynthesis